MIKHHSDQFKVTSIDQIDSFLVFKISSIDIYEPCYWWDALFSIRPVCPLILFPWIGLCTIHAHHLSLSLTEAITKTITITTQKRTLSIGWIAEYAHAHSTNGMHSLCVAIVVVLVISLVIAAVGPGLYLLQC